jgi:hypothetical protein
MFWESDLPGLERIMKKALLFCLFAFGCATRPAPVPVPPAPKQDWMVTVTFKYDFTNFPQCSTTGTTGGNKGCISNFSWGYMQGTTPFQLKVAPLTSCTGATQPLTCTDNTFTTAGIGAVVPYVIANGFDNNGAVVASPVVNGNPVNVPIGLPTNVNETFQ